MWLDTSQYKICFQIVAVSLCFLLIPTVVTAVSLAPSSGADFPGITGAKYNFTDGPFGFGVSVSGPSISDSILGVGTESTSNVLTGTNWVTNVTITVNDNAIDDDITVSWITRHVSVPNDPTSHQTAFEWSDSLTRDGSEHSGGTPKSDQKDHSPHKDFYNATLTTTVQTDNFPILDSDEISTWGWSITGRHATTPIPEPSTWLLIASGFAGLKVLGKKLLKKK